VLAVSRNTAIDSESQSSMFTFTTPDAGNSATVGPARTSRLWVFTFALGAKRFRSRRSIRTIMDDFPAPFNRGPGAIVICTPVRFLVSTGPGI
jgi:hypothetical protein